MWIVFGSYPYTALRWVSSSGKKKTEKLGERFGGGDMGRKFTLIQTVAVSGVFSAVSFWYGFMFGKESARKELGALIERLRSGKSLEEATDS